MNTSSGIVPAQVERLLNVVHEYQQAQCRQILTQSAQEAQQILHQAYRDNRRRVHQDILARRESMRRQIASAQAKRHTLSKKYQYAADRRYLDQAWDLLQAELAKRWQQQEQRQRWVQKILGTALTRLAGSDWVVEHPHSWTVAEQQHFMDQVRQHSEVMVKFATSPDIAAGIRICAGGATIDGSLSGLLADRSRIESELLAQSYPRIRPRCG